LPDFCWYVIPKPVKMYQMDVLKKLQMAIKYINIFRSKALQNLPKLRFLVWKRTIWQPWWKSIERKKTEYIIKDFGRHVCKPIIKSG
jgi:hypothetical protein